MPKKIETRETKLEKIKSSLKEAPTTTRVKAWTFQVEKQHYVIVSFFAPRYGNQVSVYPSNKKGVKTSNTPIVNLNNSQDYLGAFDRALEILFPAEQVSETSELSEALS
jgi:hypothetical protein